MSSLNGRQREAVDTLRAIVNVSSDEEAARILDNHGWDLDEAVNFLLAVGSSHGPSIARPAPRASVSSSSQRSASSNHSGASAARSSVSASSASAASAMQVDDADDHQAEPAADHDANNGIANAGGGGYFSWVPGASYVGGALGVVGRVVRGAYNATLGGRYVRRLKCCGCCSVSDDRPDALAGPGLPPEPAPRALPVPALEPMVMAPRSPVARVPTPPPPPSPLRDQRSPVSARGPPSPFLLSALAAAADLDAALTLSMLEDAKSPSVAYIDELHSRYEFAPDFFRGSYLEAVRQAKNQNRMLFIYLSTDHHDDIERFERNTLCTEQVHDFLANNCVSWAGNVKHPDAFRLSSALAVDSFPFIAVLIPQGNQVAMVHRSNGLIPADELVAKLVLLLDAHSSIVSQTQVQTQQRTTVHDEARSLRVQQDLEYEEALELDRQRRREEEEARRIEQQRQAEEEKRRLEALDIERKEQERLQALERYRDEKRASLPPEPPAGPDAVVVAVRLPNGSKVQRRFLASNLMQVIFDFIESHELSVDGVPIGRYQVMMNYPKTIFTDPNANLRQAGLGRNCLLFVQEVDDHGHDQGAASTDS